LFGELSPVLGNLTQLRVLSLPFHQLSGEISSRIWDLKNLRVFDFEGNSLSGNLPGEFTGLTKLRVLNLGFNRISGEIPISLSKCRGLQVLNLQGNEFNGLLPRFLGSYSKLKELYLSSNRFVGSVPNELTVKCWNLQHLDLSVNFLTGKIPRALGNCNRLRTILFFSNQFVGFIPLELGRLSRLESLDLSKNKLNGYVPVSLTNLRNLKHIALAGNNLCGSTSSLNFSSHSRRMVWQSFKELSISPSYLPENQNQTHTSLPSNSNPGKKGLRSLDRVVIISVSVFVAVVLLIVIIFFCSRKQKENKSPTPNPIPVPRTRQEIHVFKNVGVPLTLDTILQSTANFSSSNCIGNGGFGATYKAVLSSGIVLAVKRLTIERCQGIRQFNAEVHSLSGVKHDNLITLVGYYASRTEMFLIYNYLPGGNLEEFIQRANRIIDWKVLYKIALDVASALNYLHNMCQPRILHRDIKPSNILLDDDLNAYVSDFGLSKLLGDSQTHATTGVAGTFGYVSPEYALTCRVTEKADVYSYGVVLLELISDKRALDPSFSAHADGFTIVTWASLMVKRGEGMDVFADGLWDSGPKDDMMEVLHLAVMCTADSLSARPTIKQVVNRLRQLRPRS
jgi:hypothetical protein